MINIALNTIIYIMVFLFPGVLFRRAFFSGKFTKQFDAGNPLERLFWNLLLSFICISFFFYSISLINNQNLIKFKIETGFTIKELIETFKNLYENKFPIKFSEPEFLLSCFKIISSLYIYSILIGFFINKIIFNLGLEKRFGFLRFQNNWDYLTISNNQNNSNHTVGDIYSTKVDIKTKDGNLFTGTLYETLFDKDGKIDTIAIKEAYKFYRLKFGEDFEIIQNIKKEIDENNPFLIFHSENDETFVYRRRIKGEIFSINNCEIENISITYIKITDLSEKYRKYLKIVVSILILLVTLLSIAYGIWDFNIFTFTSIYKRIGLAIVTPFAFSMLILFLIQIFNFQKLRRETKKYFLNLKDSAIIFSLILFPYTYIFLNLKFYLMIILWFLYFLFSATLLSRVKK